jgi:hypothetical protein
MKYLTIATAITIASIAIMSTWAQGKQTELKQAPSGLYERNIEQAIGEKI